MAWEAATLDGDEVLAIYEPEPGGWTARVRWVQISAHMYYRFHVVVIDPDGHSSYTCFATMISEAWRVAESNVYTIRHDLPGL